MEIKLVVPTYDRYKGVEIEWVDGHEILVAIENHEVIIHANPEGLRTLAIQLLTLAQDGMPSGNHIHLSDVSGLDEGSADLTLIRK
jgi:hypothetical protein